MATRGFENFTATDAARHALKHTRRPIAGPTARSGRRSKYGAVKVTIDGITFDSKREAARYGELKALEQAGEISRLCCQPSYPLEVVWFGFGLKPDKSTVIGIYRADFAYFDRRSNCEVVEDVKGMKTPVYRLKKKHVEAQYGIQIREIR